MALMNISKEEESFDFDFDFDALWLFYFRVGWYLMSWANRSSLKVILSGFQTQSHQKTKITTLIAR